MIQAKHLEYRFGAHTLVDALSFELEPQKLHMVLGANGAGKSTLIKLLSGQLKPTNGKVFFNGQDISLFQPHELAKIRAVLSQSVDFAFPLTVLQVVLMGRYPHFTNNPRQIDRDIVVRAMKLFDIDSFSTRIYNTLSGGEKQRVHFARVISQIWPEDIQLRYLFLDEPLTYLDVKYQYDFLNKIKELISKHNICVVGVLHDLNLGIRFADSLLLMHQSKLLAQGQADVVLSNERIEQMYSMTPRFIQGLNSKYVEF